jgi:hypothetical protein
MTEGVLLQQVMEDKAGIRQRLEREQSKMTHEVFLLAESGGMPDETERRGRARAATARAWMTHIGASIEPVWHQAPVGLGEMIERWFAVNGERLEVIELALATLIADGPIDDYDTRARRVDLGAAARWLGEAVGALCDPTGSGGPAFARRLASYLDANADTIAQLAGDGRVEAPDDPKVAESAELFAHVRTTVAGLEALLADVSADPAPSA